MKNDKDIHLLAREIAFNRLDRRECSKKEIALLLEKKGIPKQVALEVISFLVDRNLISDERFARLMTREQLNREKGPRVIQQKLQNKGIRLELADIKILTQELTQTSELETAKKFVERRYPQVGTDQKESVRAFQALIRRGFSYSVAHDAIASLRRASGKAL